MLNQSKDSELFLGIITTVGTQTDGVINDIKIQLRFFEYDAVVISVSKDVISQFERNPFVSKNEFDRVSHYMDLGNSIRERSSDSSILMKGVAQIIYNQREKDENDNSCPKPRTAYIINSLKNPSEVEFMRETYGDAFHLIGITSNRSRRLQFLTERRGLNNEDAQKLLTRDENEEIDMGQHTRDAFQLSDYFINITENTDITYNSVVRRFWKATLAIV